MDTDAYAMMHRHQQLSQPHEEVVVLFSFHVEVNSCFMFSLVFFIFATVSSSLIDHLPIPIRSQSERPLFEGILHVFVILRSNKCNVIVTDASFAAP